VRDTLPFDHSTEKIDESVLADEGTYWHKTHLADVSSAEFVAFSSNDPAAMKETTSKENFFEERS
jgi:hypothetical protein